MSNRRDATSYLGKRVFVYRNLHRGCMSIRYKGRVVGHHDSVQLLGAEFKVGKAGQERVRRTKCKNVHAGVWGILVSVGEEYGAPHINEIYYNPYKVDTFVEKDTGFPKYRAHSAYITNGRIYV